MPAEVVMIGERHEGSTVHVSGLTFAGEQRFGIEVLERDAVGELVGRRTHGCGWR